MDLILISFRRDHLNLRHLKKSVMGCKLEHLEHVTMDTSIQSLLKMKNIYIEQMPILRLKNNLTEIEIPLFI